jgi:hypothetical protein
LLQPVFQKNEGLGRNWEEREILERSLMMMGKNALQALPGKPQDALFR